MFRILHTKARTKQFEDRIRDLSRNRKKSFDATVRKTMLNLIDKLKEETPADTGAAANDLSRAVRPIYWSHPAVKMGLPIGDNDGIGGSGWQYKEDASSSYKTDFMILNPMWIPYLRLFEYGIVNSKEKGNIAGYVKRLWYEAKEELRK